MPSENIQTASRMHTKAKLAGRDLCKTRYLSHPRRRVPSAKQHFACLTLF